MFIASKVKKIIAKLQNETAHPEKNIRIKSNLYKDLDFSDSFSDLDGKVLIADLLYEIEEYFGIEFSDEDIEKITNTTTVQDIVRMVNKSRREAWMESAARRNGTKPQG